METQKQVYQKKITNYKQMSAAVKQKYKKNLPELRCHKLILILVKS